MWTCRTLPIHAEQAGRVASQDSRFLLVGETFGGIDMIHRMLPAPGVDRLTWKDYEVNLEGNIEDLHDPRPSD